MALATPSPTIASDTPHGGACRPPGIGTQGVVASAHGLASLAGLRVLMEGGNAVDAAVAVAASLSVVEPFMSGPGGGGGYLLFFEAKTGRVHGLNYLGHAPRAATAARRLVSGAMRRSWGRSWDVVGDIQDIGMFPSAHRRHSHPARAAEKQEATDRVRSLRYTGQKACRSAYPVRRRASDPAPRGCPCRWSATNGRAR